MAQITRANIGQIRADIEAAMKAIYAKHGIDVVVGNIRYNDSSFRCKLEGNVRGANGTVATPKAAALGKIAKITLGSAFDETKTYHSPSLGRVKVTGYNEKAFKYPFVVKQLSTGKQFKITTMSAKSIVANGEVA